MRARTIYSAVVLLSLSVLVSCEETELRQPPGLSVQNGTLLLKGEPYRGIGVNYFSLFYRTLKDPSDTSYQKELSRLSKAGIPFVRFMASGFWPAEWELYLRDKDAHFKLLDSVVKSAEQANVGLIPSLFWNLSTVPDIVGEPIDQLGNPKSKTIEFIRQYTKEIVLRYKNSPAIWGWELGNEYNLVADLPNASEHRPPVWPTLKTALKRTERDELSSKAMLTAFTEFAHAVRMHDKHRSLLTGNSIPRTSAFHNSKDKSWKKDSREQFEEILLRDNPDPYQMICVHLYPDKNNKYAAGTSNIADLVKTVQDISIKAKKPLFIGEFGAPVTLGEAKARSSFLELLEAIEVNKIPLSALWVFDFPG